MTAIQNKLQELRNAGWQIAEPMPVELPLPSGGASMLLPSVGASLFSAPGAAVAHEVHGSILIAYIAQGGPMGALGFPVSDETVWYDNASRLNAFQNGVITWNAELGASVHRDRVVQPLGICAANAYALLSMPTDVAAATVHAAEGVAAGVEWCGYTIAYLMKAAGFDKPHTALFPSTLGLLQFGSYYTLDIYGAAQPRQRITKLMPAGTDIRDVHATRGSPRRITLWPELQAGTPLDIVPGDIVLVDSRKGGGPDHIQIVWRWHPTSRVLTTIDGNGGSFVLRSVLQQKFGPSLQPNVHFRPTTTAPLPGTTVSTQEKRDYIRTLDGLDVLWPMPSSGYVSIGCHVLTAAGQVNPPTPTSETPHSRVFAIIRPSIVDFENHSYQNI
jgi:hypothetical protein